MEHRTAETLEAALDHIRAAPRDAGTVELIVRRPRTGEREVLDEAVLELGLGLVGDNWRERKSPPNPEVELTVMSVRAIAALADRDRWPLAGDQLYVDLDLGVANLPIGSRLAIGTAVLEVTAKPHTGCAKFTARFGSDATRWANTPTGRDLRLRGIHARLVEPGRVRRGDVVKKLS